MAPGSRQRSRGVIDLALIGFDLRERAWAGIVGLAEGCGRQSDEGFLDLGLHVSVLLQ